MDSHKRAVTEWLQCNRAIHEKTEQLAKLRERRSSLSEYILRHPDRLDPASTLQVVERNHYAPLTYGLLGRCLDECVEDKDAVAQLMAYVKSRRKCDKVKEIVVVRAKNNIKEH